MADQKAGDCLTERVEAQSATETQVLEKTRKEPRHCTVYRTPPESNVDGAAKYEVRSGRPNCHMTDEGTLEHKSKTQVDNLKQDFGDDVSSQLRYSSTPQSASGLKSPLSRISTFILSGAMRRTSTKREKSTNGLTST